MRPEDALRAMADLGEDVDPEAWGFWADLRWRQARNRCAEIVAQTGGPGDTPVDRRPTSGRRRKETR